MSRYFHYLFGAIYLWLWLVSLPAWGQNQFGLELRSGQDSLPIASALVIWAGTAGDTLQTTTDADGRCAWESASQTGLLVVRSLGYLTWVGELNAKQPMAYIWMQAEELEVAPPVQVWAQHDEGDSAFAPLASPHSQLWIQPHLIANTNAFNFRQILRQIPGVSVFENQIVVRGGGGLLSNNGSQTQVILDGIPQLTPDYNAINWGTIPTEILAQAQLRKGANAVLYGSNALNGALELQTRWPADKPWTQITTFYQVYGRYRPAEFNWWDRAPYQRGLSAGHASRLGKRVDLVLGLNLSEGQSYLRGVSASTNRLTFKLRRRAKQLGSWEYGLSGSVMQDDEYQFLVWDNDSTGINQPFRSPWDADTPSSLVRFNRQILQLNPYLIWQNASGTQHRFTGRYYGLRITNYFYMPITWSGGMNYDFRASPGRHWLIKAGASWQQFHYRQANKPDRFATAMSSIYGFARWDKAGWRANLGFRIEAFDSHLQPLTALPVLGAGLSYRLGRGHALRLNINQGYRFPSLLELAEAQPDQAIPIYPNPDLRVETGWTAELGYRKAITPSIFADAAFFVKDMHNLIDYMLAIFPPDSITPPYSPEEFERYFGFQPQNISRVRFGGWDLSLNGQHTTDRAQWRFTAGWMYVYPVNLREGPQMENWWTFLGSVWESVFSAQPFIEDALLINRQRHLLKADLETQVGHWTLGATYLHQSGIERLDPLFAALIPNLQDFRRDYPQQSTIINARIAYDFGQWGRVSILARNLFNRVYSLRPAKLEPPRSFTLQYRISF